MPGGGEAVVPVEAAADARRAPAGRGHLGRRRSGCRSRSTNETDDALDADARRQVRRRVQARRQTRRRARSTSRPARSRALFFPLEVVATDGDADVDARAARRAASTTSSTKKIRVVPLGFPFEVVGLGHREARRTPRATSFELAGALPGSIQRDRDDVPVAARGDDQGHGGHDPRARRLLRADLVDELPEHHDPRLPRRERRGRRRARRRRRRARSTTATSC